MQGLLFLKLQMQAQNCWGKQNPVDLHCSLFCTHPGLHSKSWGSLLTFSLYRAGFKNIGGGTLQRQIL